MPDEKSAAATDTPLAEIGDLAERAAEAFAVEQTGRTFDHAAFMDIVAERLEDRRDCLVPVARRESGLGEARLHNELTRTVRQLRAFAGLVRAGSETDVIIDLARVNSGERRPDQRRMAVPIGPVAVFAASNFPFAFSVAGGDTAAAWAAGCPVLMKAHPAHPRTSALTATAINEAVTRVGAPEAWFSIVYGATVATGQTLITAPAVRAVAFTGSYIGGVAIARAASARPDPIPAFCEMGSVNPVVITPAAAYERGPEIADGLTKAITGSAGQLCTKPGLVLLVDDSAGRTLAAALASSISEVPAARMLYEAIESRFVKAVNQATQDPRIRVRVPLDVVQAPDGANGEIRLVQPTLLEMSASELNAEDPLADEMFGPASLLLWAQDEADLMAAVRRLPGTLTATLHAGQPDPIAQAVVAAFAERAGRIVYNGYPTGVTVGYATVHGGPFPSTTAPAHTSVGMTAVRRFQRPLGYQDVPDELLPPALQDENPLHIERRVDGQVTSAAIRRNG